MTHRDGFPRLSASTRVAWRCGTSVAMRDAARKPWETAVPGGQANRQRANRWGRRKALPMSRRTRGFPPTRPLARRIARAISMGHYQRSLVLPLLRWPKNRRIRSGARQGVDFAEFRLPSRVKRCAAFRFRRGCRRALPRAPEHAPGRPSRRRRTGAARPDFRAPCIPGATGPRGRSSWRS